MHYLTSFPVKTYQSKLFTRLHETKLDCRVLILMSAGLGQIWNYSKINQLRYSRPTPRKAESESDPRLLGIMPKIIYKSFHPIPWNKDTDYWHCISLQLSRSEKKLSKISKGTRITPNLSTLYTCIYTAEQFPCTL